MRRPTCRSSSLTSCAQISDRMVSIVRSQLVVTGQVCLPTTTWPELTAVIQLCRVTLFARMDDNADAQRILLASHLVDWRRQHVCSRITWLNTVQQDLRHHNLTLPEAMTVAQSRPLWRMLLTYHGTAQLLETPTWLGRDWVSRDCFSLFLSCYHAVVCLVGSDLQWRGMGHRVEQPR